MVGLSIVSSIIFTPGRRQSKTLLTIDERGSKLARNSVFDCYLTPDWRQMAIKNSVKRFLSTFVDSISVFDCRLTGVYMMGAVTVQCSVGQLFPLLRQMTRLVVV